MKKLVAIQKIVTGCRYIVFDLFYSHTICLKSIDSLYNRGRFCTSCRPCVLLPARVFLVNMTKNVPCYKQSRTEKAREEFTAPQCHMKGRNISQSTKSHFKSKRT